MQMIYSDKAKTNGVYVVGACGWDSIPCDLGVHFTKKEFEGDLNHIETFVQLNTGPAVSFIFTLLMLLLLLGIFVQFWHLSNVDSCLCQCSIGWTRQDSQVYYA